MTNESARYLLRIADDLDENAAKMRGLADHLREGIGVPVEVRVRKPRPAVTDRSRILASIARAGSKRPTTVASLAKRFPSIHRYTIGGHLRALAQQGKVEKVAAGLYRRVVP